VSLVGLILDGLLIALLLAALAYGMRLDRRLRAIRDGQSAFAGTVKALDEATRRAEIALAELKGTAAEAHDELHDRILKARELRTELEALTARGERAAHALSGVAPSRREAAPAPKSEAAVIEDAAPLQRLERRLAELVRPPARDMERSVERTPERRPAARLTDDDLFEAPPPRRAPGDR
jgi:hypothetical protein